MIRYIVLSLLVLILALDFFSRVLPQEYDRDTVNVPEPLNKTFESLDIANLSINNNLFGEIADDKKSKEQKEKPKAEQQPTKLEKLTVKLVATYTQVEPYALIQVKDKQARRVGQFQRVRVGDTIDGFTVDSISSDLMTLSRKDKNVTVKVFEGP